MLCSINGMTFRVSPYIYIIEQIHKNKISRCTDLCEDIDTRVKNPVTNTFKTSWVRVQTHIHIDVTHTHTRTQNTKHKAMHHNSLRFPSVEPEGLP